MKDYFDMSQIPASKIRQIIEEAMEGKYDTFDKVMSHIGIAMGMQPHELTKVQSRNILVAKKELHDCLHQLKTQCDNTPPPHMIEDMVSKLFDKFLEICAQRELEIHENISDQINQVKRDDISPLNLKLSYLESQNHELTNALSSLQNENSGLASQLSAANVEIENLKKDVDWLKKVKASLELDINQKILDLEFEIKLMRQSNT